MLKKLLSVITLSTMLVGLIPMGVFATSDTTLSGKKILFTGDSIGAGWRDSAGVSDYSNSGGWAKRIQDTYGAEVTLSANAGSPLSTIRESENRPAIVKQIIANKNNTYDYIVLQGGFNDAMGTNTNPSKETAAPVGTVGKTFDVKDFDTSTFAGALENLFYYTTLYFPDTKVGFIITYNTPLSTYGGYTGEETSMRKYWDTAKEICEKWDIDYLDLFDGKTAQGLSYSKDILKVNTSENFPGGSDNIHLKASGYDVITPYIAEWIKTLSVPEIKQSTGIISDFILDFEKTYTDIGGSEFYSGITNFSGAGNGRGSHAELITETNGNKALRLTYDTDNNNENYNANAATKIFDPVNKTVFKGEADKTYIISFSYKVEETDGQSLQLSVANCGRTNNFYATDLRLDNVSAMGTQNVSVKTATGIITEVTEGYATASVKWKANGTDYPIIGLVTNEKQKDSTHTGQRPYASVLIDNIEISEMGVTSQTDIELNFEDTYPTNDGQSSGTVSFYSNSNSQFFMTSNNVRGSHAELITESNSNKAIRLTYDNDASNWNPYENYNANPAIMIYDPDTKTRFKGKAGKTYVISFQYKVEETDGKDLQLYVVNCGQKSNLWGVNLDRNNTGSMGTSDLQSNKAGGVITETSKNYITVSASWTANGTDYPLILLETNSKSTDSSHDGTRPYASVLIDNVKVTENVKKYIVCHNYGSEDSELLIDLTTTFSDLIVPSLAGYLFDGWYTDAEFKNKADENELVSKYNEIYVKWSGDGSIVTPSEITNVIPVNNIKGFRNCTISQSNNASPFVENSIIEQTASSLLTAKSSDSWYGSYVFSDEKTTYDNTFTLNNISLSVNTAGSVIFYTELSNFASAGKNYGLGIKEVSLTQNSKNFSLNLSGKNSIRYLQSGSETWKTATLDSFGNINGLPSGFKGYISIDFSLLSFNSALNLTSKATLNKISLNLNAIGSNAGSLILGGILYTSEKTSDSTVMQIEGKVFDISKSNAMTVNVYDTYNEKTNSISVRYSGTSAEVGAEYKKAVSNAPWAENSVNIISKSKNTLTTTGYMNTFRTINTKILMQPSVDTFMVYLELPEYSSEVCAVKFLPPTLIQGKNSTQINFSNSIYKYLDTESGVWKTARAGADGELYALKSGFKGYVKFDIKSFKGFTDIESIDFSKPYYINTVEIGVNHLSNENNPFVIGAFYSLIKDSDTALINNGITNESICAAIIEGDLDLNAVLDSADLALLKKAIAGITELDKEAYLRAEKISGGKPNASGLAKLKKYIAGLEKLPATEETSGETEYKNIFSEDVKTTNKVHYFGASSVTDYQKIIEADKSLNEQQKAKDFANEIQSSKITDFEKTGIDKMAHVSTFIYANGNIYTSYYANTVSAYENPAYQTARLSYCSEEKPEDKIIIDIQSVGDDLYGQKVLGVYDTILMKKENDNKNLYILWTANVAGQYYRLYRIFDMETETLGEIGVNRFKVGNVTNDFSTSGIESALTANNIGLKQMFSDIGIMQKLSSRVENGETYYYTGAYSGNFTWIIKSKDLVTWEYVAQPDIGNNGTGFTSLTKWENAVYVLNDKVYYFVRQWDPEYDTNGNLKSGSPYGILTYYDLNTGEWETPILVGDCQSRSDFIMYNGNLYLFYAPTDRNHIGILKIGTEDLADTSVVLQANMNGSCFYPFVQYNSKGELCMSYTIDRHYIRLASFTLSKYLD